MFDYLLFMCSHVFIIKETQTDINSVSDIKTKSYPRKFREKSSRSIAYSVTTQPTRVNNLHPVYMHIPLFISSLITTFKC